MAAICLLMAGGSASAQTAAEKKASAVVTDYLNRLGYGPQIDPKDNSVNFYAKDKDKTFYWITFDETSPGIIYTLHRKPIKMQSENDTPEQVVRKTKYAAIAANRLNAEAQYKTYVKDTRVDFVFSNFASSPEEYVKIFPGAFKSMQNIAKDFKKLYDEAKNENPVNEIIVPQPNNNVAAPKQGVPLEVTGYDFRVVDGKTVISDYGKPIRKSGIKYIQPCIYVKSPDKGVYDFGVVIYDPTGKKLIPTQGAYRSIMTTIEITKKEKNKEVPIELDVFGTDDGSIWQNGEYKVEFYENNLKIGETTFNIL